MAGWLVIACCVGVIATAIVMMGDLHSLATREAMQRQLARYDLRGVDVDRVLGIVRVVGTVAACCAAALGVLAWFTMQGSRSSRIGAAIVAVPMAFTGFSVNPLLAPAAAVGVVLFFTGSAGAWFRAPSAPAAPPPGGWPPPR